MFVIHEKLEWNIRYSYVLYKHPDGDYLIPSRRQNFEEIFWWLNDEGKLISVCYR